MVELSMKEEHEYEVIKKLADHNGGNKQRTALELDVSLRTIYRYLDGYKTYGKEYFLHGNAGRKPANTTDPKVIDHVVALYEKKYYGTNFTHFAELLTKYKGITLSVPCITAILESHNIFSPRMTRKKKKRLDEELRKEMKRLEEAGAPKKEIESLRKRIINVADAHSRRPRCKYFGELLQMDASGHKWFNGEMYTLHVAIDDATGMIVGAYFDKEETLNGYYHVMEEILTIYGIPFKILTDRRTVFEYKKRKAPPLSDDTMTQFAYACKQLGVTLETTSTPQTKGRVERLFETLQSRLPVELKQAGITTASMANEFLTSYIMEFNARFALHANDSNSVFEKQPSAEKINLILAILDERAVDNGHCVKYYGRYYRTVDADGKHVNFMKGTKAMVIKAYDGELYCSVDDKAVYMLEEVPDHEEKSKEFDADYEARKPEKRNIPKMRCSWTRESFEEFALSQSHHSDESPHSFSERE